MHKQRILIIEDTTSMAVLYANYVAIAGYEADIAHDGHTGLAMLTKQTYQALLLDMHLPDMHGLEILRKVRQYYDDMPVIIVTAFGSIGLAVQSMQYGAFDFVTKPFSPARINTTLDNAIRHRRLHIELKELRRETHKEGFYDFIGSSPAMQAVYRQIESISGGKANIFISGENGTGKEMAARTIHRLSPRATHPFAALDVSKGTPEEIDSQLFGDDYGKLGTRKGLLDTTRSGTLFLENIEALPHELQTKLLRYFQTGMVASASASGLKPDVRFICASSRDVMEMAQKGTFREDLYHRLHIVPLAMPALREREDDMVELATHFLKLYADQENKHFTGFEPDALALLRQQEWPDNVHQLAAVLRHIVMVNDGPRVRLNMLPADMQKTKPKLHAIETEEEQIIVKPLWQMEKETILRALQSSQNDVPRAAALLEVSPSTIYRKLQAWRGVSDSDIMAISG